jgi:hypothetical protein
MIGAGLTVSQWPAYMREVYRILKPGSGWYQAVEMKLPYAVSEDNSLPKDAPLNKVINHYRPDSND